MSSFTAWRHAAYDTPVRNISSRRNGRYNTVASEPTQYLSLHPWGPWAEVLRWEDRQQPSEARELSGRIWVLRLEVTGAVEVVSFDNARDFGVSPDELVAEDHSACQSLAARARARGVAALVVPSAALPGTDNLVVLGPRVLSPWAAAPVDDVDVPAAVAADRAGPPLALLPHVRWRGQEHGGLTAWSSGAGGPFLEPVPTPL